MKKTAHITLVLAIMLILFGTHANAGVRYGIIGGINLSNMNGEYADGQALDFVTGKNTAGFGLVFDFDFAENLGVRIEPIFTQKGATQDEPADGEIWEIAYKGQYIEMPILFKWTFLKNNIQPYLVAGPSIGVKLKYADGPSVERFETAGIDLSATGGLGLSFTFGNTNLFIEGRYCYGLTDVFTNGTTRYRTTGNSWDDASVKNQGIMVLIGVTSPLAMP